MLNQDWLSGCNHFLTKGYLNIDSCSDVFMGGSMHRQTDEWDDKHSVRHRGVATGGGGARGGGGRKKPGKFCHKWQHLWLLAHPIKFGQFYKNSIFGRLNPPIKVVSRRPWSDRRMAGQKSSRTKAAETSCIFRSRSF